MRVSQDGEVRFEFKPIAKQVTAIPDPVRKLFGDTFVQQCLEKNHSPYQPAGQPTMCPK